MDSDNELARAKWLLIAVLVFLVSGCLSWGEAVYLVGGRDATAAVEKAYEVTSRRGGARLKLDYAFTEAGGARRTGTDTVSRDWPINPDLTVPVRYTPGADGRSRLAGHVNWVALVAFGASLAAVGWFGLRLLREARRETRGRA